MSIKSLHMNFNSHCMARTSGGREPSDLTPYFPFQKMKDVIEATTHELETFSEIHVLTRTHMDLRESF